MCHVLDEVVKQILDPSHGGHSAAVNHVFSAGDGRRTRRREKGDEVRHFFRPGRASDRDAAE